MSDKSKNPDKDPKKTSSVTERQNDELDIGNDISMGSVTGAGVSDFDPDRDSPETEEREYREESSDGDDQRSDDNGINPSPREMDSQKSGSHPSMNIENADEDKMNPYPDELKPDDDDEHFNSTWMMSGRNKKI
ncbi:MAG: hypothetical protein V4721_10955 [Bacteroidota bacterium]